MFLDKIDYVAVAIPSICDAIILAGESDSIYDPHWGYILVVFVPGEVRAQTVECFFDLDLMRIV